MKPKPIPDRPSVYVFLDVENIPAHNHAYWIRLLAKQYGEVNPARLRAYAVNWRVRKKSRVMLEETGFSTVRVSPGHNAVDNKIFRDCLIMSKIRQTLLPEVYILSTGDSDFVPVVDVLHERNHYVVCLTSKHRQASQELIQVVDEHYCLEDLPTLLAEVHQNHKVITVSQSQVSQPQVSQSQVSQSQSAIDSKSPLLRGI
ncbi:MAG: hypothetical protein B0A82_06100 [Alkalinema sp. CACIAM 70d]|nr:MAG: hypothetical protein B0A82_06100 [Alkalinema sp. CACIAM 70d]